ncbi:amoebapore C, putative [Entamoeba histolytica HM-3:IMSS]|uniref:Pore-forming peptide amoebapore C n=7 Tax=Entamoeba histolytica TaxID=5759 RepID=PFPC_ENTH1|nr:amoebapore C [Entamoeba histolytica HM-1:IMSS]Q24825.1 RecName: Full=Pore-forming peptide amoebapore C; AltName: Full=EH-APP C; Flags: Precursor [Entamoeba histolytica HM-1:IMSS]EMD44214.1 amoebapore C, putative [Entamoeba histolytica KU27]EMS12851.1 amoebapore C, putative [Entamoeba histolytica HM-3:IMSS]CAA54225.1 precursor of amoebapore C [Entamoeba histolytica]EAL50647.1 amoebapore C [Entamoeba histolytica HM-1:IMSS]GAT94077.1 amoebapore c [Entamoeba histolytica]|eukprot:XP_656029.1 amoebapore C [Entamoeba histolytica HM-1:IMSS]
MKLFVLLCVFVLCLASQEKQQDREIPVLCPVCTSLVGKLIDLVLGGAVDKVTDYLETLCAKADGLVETLCTKIVSYGIDKLIEKILEGGSAKLICGLIHAC